MAQWHWVSSAICLVGMILVTVTGITLNHAADIEATPTVTSRTTRGPTELLATWNEDAPEETGPLPSTLIAWLRRELGSPIGSQPAEWNEVEVDLSMPGPGTWLGIECATGAVEFERTIRGWIACFNDRNTGLAWKWFLDLFAVASLVFCITGLFLLDFHARHRRITSPLVGLGFAIPLVLALIAMH